MRKLKLKMVKLPIDSHFNVSNIKENLKVRIEIHINDIAYQIYEKVYITFNFEVF